MEIRQLECFVAVADLSSFTRAAWLLQVPQPALSRQVRALEVELRQTLFHRNGRGVSLTEAGKRFLGHCRGILVQIERARTELDNARDDPSGEVVLGLPHSIARLVTVPCVLEFRRQFPQGTLRVTEGLTVHLQEWLLAGRLDLALLHDPVPTPMLEIFPLHEQSLHVVGTAAGGKPLPPTIELAQLADIPLVLPGRQIFIVDTHVNVDPTPEQLCEITIMAAEEVRRFGIVPKIALLSHSNFGTSNAPSAIKMRETLALLKERAPELDVDGEMHGDVALDSRLRAEVLPESTLEGDANLLVLPNIDAANISYNLLKTAAGNNIAIGPILLGAAQPVHVLTASATVRRIVNMTALLVADTTAVAR